jgi:hypothetical protein
MHKRRPWGHYGRGGRGKIPVASAENSNLKDAVHFVTIRLLIRVLLESYHITAWRHDPEDPDLNFTAVETSNLAKFNSENIVPNYVT